MKLGRIIRKRGLETWTSFNDSYCYSACVLAFAGGVVRIATDDQIGVHSFYSPEFLGTEAYQEIEEVYEIVSNDIREYLNEMRVSSVILDLMTATSYRSIRHLSMRTLIDIGFIGFDPVYDQMMPRPQ